MRVTGTSLRHVVVVLLALAGGCTTTQQIQRPADLTSFQRVASATGRPVSVLYAPSREGELVAVTGTGLVVEGPKGELQLTLPEVRGFETRSHFTGALDGLGVGLATGAILGVVVGFASGDDEPGTCFICFEARDKAAVGAVLFGLTGGLTGLVIGALTGHTDRFVF